MVDVQLSANFVATITLATLRKHEQRALKGLAVLTRGNRLSITPVSAAHGSSFSILLSEHDARFASNSFVIRSASVQPITLRSFLCAMTIAQSMTRWKF